MSSVSTSPAPVNVVCMKWGVKFGTDYANRLYAMVRRNLHRPFRFVCFTDYAEGLHPGIEALPLPDVRWGSEHGVNAHGWRKVGLFAAELGDLRGPTLFLDLDVVIVDSIDPFFDVPGEVVVIKDYRPIRIRGDWFVGNTSALRFNVGAHPEVLEEFRRDFPAISRRLRNEQEFLSHHFHRLGLLRYWPKPWCPSFKADCVAFGPLSYFFTPKKPADARIVVFHGRPQPEQALVGQGGKLLRTIRPTPWIADYWHDRDLP